MIKRFYSPLRYPGGKQQLAEYVKAIIAVNNLYDGIYVEPYAGGASIALDLLFSEYVRDIFLNDLDKNIAAFWYCVVHDTEEMISRLLSTPATISNWEMQREVLRNANENTPNIDRAFATLYLNRCNRSGILKGGPIGGKAQTGVWKINARYNAPELAERIRRIGQYKNCIHVSNKDCLDFLSENKSEFLSRKHLIYLDPPYYYKSQDLYLSIYKDENHTEIRDFVKKEMNNMNWILSYDACKEISDLYQGFRCTTQVLNYSASHTKSRGKEFMFYNDNIIIPSGVEIIDFNDAIKKA